MKALRLTLAAFLAACFITASAFAADASPTGTWKFMQQGRGGNSQGIERTVKLEEKDGKVTGTMMGWQAGNFNIPDTAIGDGTFKNGTVSFTVTTEFNGNKRVSKYEGKLSGDTITGTTERPGRDGAVQKSEWVAKRSK